VGAYIARQNIAVGEALAYTRGQRVEADAVKDNGWEDLVAGDGTKEAREILAEVTGREITDFDSKTSQAATRAAAKTQEG
jgi:hypothetical protein